MSDNPRDRLAELPTGAKTGAGLIAIVGAAAAGALFIDIPRDESGREVSVELTQDGKEAIIRHVRGKQYLTAYKDIVSVGTACDGITRYKGKPIVAGTRFTEQQCADLLSLELERHALGVMKCTPGLALDDHAGIEKAKAGMRVAAVSLAYNVGVAGYCGSTARKRFNAGDYAGGCKAMTWWNKAGGRVVRGLQLRRAREYKTCMEGL